MRHYAAAAALLLAGHAFGAPAALDFDVVVYGATPAGCAAAIAARNHTAGALRVALSEPTAHVGGMAGPGARR